MLEAEEIEAIAQRLEERLAQREAAVAATIASIERPVEVRGKAKHWPRRVFLAVLVLAGGVVVHYLIEETGARSALQSAELGMGALIEVIFTRVKE